MIFAELEAYATARLGPTGWGSLRAKANLPNKIYLVSQSYDDADVVALVGAASQLTGLPASAILEDFGCFIVPGLLKLYGRLAKPDWRTLDLIEHTEATIHNVVRRRNPNALPPMLKVTRLNARELNIDYTSNRKLCHLAKGIVRGIAYHYKEAVVIRETSCMHRGSDRCLIKVMQRKP